MTIIFNHSLKTLFLPVAAAIALEVVAQDVPEILTVAPFFDGALSGMSANGTWAFGDAENPNNSSYRAYPRIVDTSSGQQFNLFSKEEADSGTPISVTCVSNDGSTAAGSYEQLPAVWTATDGWKLLPLPSSIYNAGLVSAITPDARYAVGRVSIDLFREFPCLWDLNTFTLINLPGIPDSNPRYIDMISSGGDSADWSQKDVNVRLTGISPDGNSLLGMVDFAYPATAWEFIYFRNSNSWIPLGMNYADGKLTPSDPDIYNVDECVFSADGSYIGGVYYSSSENYAPFSCSADNPRNFTIHKDDLGIGVWAIGSDGSLYGASPFSTPIRNWSVKTDGYWYDWKLILSQIYGIDWLSDVAADEDGLSGTVVAVAADNKTILATDWTIGTSYLISLPKPLAEICADVDLLANYNLFPPDGAEFSMLQTVTLDMGLNVQVVADKYAVSLFDASGNRVKASINFTTRADNQNYVEIIFRNYRLSPGEDYTIVVPAESIQIAGDESKTNKEFKIHYRGRDNSPVKPLSISPEDGANVARLNITTNPVIVNFDSYLDIYGEGNISLWQIKNGVEEYLYPLNAEISGRQITVYPISEQRLADGSDYRITFDAGLVSDLSGACPNEAFSVSYHGCYTPEIDPSSNIIFKEDFSNGVYGMLLFDGDSATPSEEMQTWGFSSSGTPWIPVCDDDSYDTNYAAASHSSYNPAGKSDDWMMTPQLFIPDDKAFLSFSSQSFRSDNFDSLKVYVFESNEVITIITPNLTDQIRYEGDLIYNQLQFPGDREDVLENEWTENIINLSKYAGKYIYIAFVNDNQNQSAVFVDDIIVSREVAALISIDTPSALVNADETEIKGRFEVMKESGINGYSLEVFDNDGNLLSSIQSDESLSKGDRCSFSFPSSFPLLKGEVNTFNISFHTGLETTSISAEIKNLLFETTKQIVLEELTGTTCQFCPQGIIAIEYLQKLYADRFIPIAIHSYVGDKFGSAEIYAYSEFLQLNAAPTGRICRGDIANPMYFSGSDYLFTSPDGNTWLSHAQDALSELPVADIKINETLFNEENKSITANFDAIFAVNLTNTNINVFAVIMEDDVYGIQTNGLSNSEYPGLGEWGKGGEFGKGMVPFYYDDVVRATSAVETNSGYSGFNGTSGFIPSSITAGQPINVSLDIPLPSTISNIANTKVCIFLLDGNSGDFINASVTPRDADNFAHITDASPHYADVYDIFGRIVLRNASTADITNLSNGIYILNGKKYVVR